MAVIRASSTAEAERQKLEQKIRRLGKWFHNMDLNGVQTAPDHFLGDYPALKWRRFQHSLPKDLAGKSVLDIGCNAGFYCLEMKKRGAGRVLGIDYDEQYLRQARFAAKVSGHDVEFMRLSVYDLHKLGEKFDIVLFMGVFYHLRYPLLALDIMQKHVVKDLFVFQSMLRGDNRVLTVGDDYPFSETDVFENKGFPKLHFVEKSYSGDPTNWWIPNRACAEALLRSAGFKILDHPEEEVYICRKTPGASRAAGDLPDGNGRPGPKQ